MERKAFLQASFGLFALSKITEEIPVGKKPFMITAGKSRFGESFRFRGKSPNDIKISGKDTDGQIAMIEYIGLERTGPPLHVHLHQDEVFYVIDGAYRFVVGDEQMMGRPGDTIFLPRNIPHTWIQLTDTGKMVYFVQPAGNVEAFFRKMNNLKHVPTETEINEIHQAYEMRVVGPPLVM